MAIKNHLARYVHCLKDHYQNELDESKLHGGLVCPVCRADQGPDHSKHGNRVAGQRIEEEAR